MEEHWTPLEPTLEGHSNYVASVALSQEGNKIVSVWDVASGRQLKKLEGHSSQVVGIP
jgi:WD40 repeat protein